MGILDIYFLPLARVDMAPVKDDMIGHKKQMWFQNKVFDLGTEVWKMPENKNKVTTITTKLQRVWLDVTKKAATK